MVSILKSHINTYSSVGRYGHCRGLATGSKQPLTAREPKGREQVTTHTCNPPHTSPVNFSVLWHTNCWVLRVSAYYMYTIIHECQCLNHYIQHTTLPTYIPHLLLVPRGLPQQWTLCDKRQTLSIRNTRVSRVKVQLNLFYHPSCKAKFN